MATALAAPVVSPARRTLADLLETLRPLGDIPPHRIRLIPPPGTVTEEDLLYVLAHENITCELIDGTLVEKARGFEQSIIAGILLTVINNYLEHHNLGVAAGPDATLRLVTGLLRLPDVVFTAWDHLPDRRLPKQPVPRLALDLVVEVISEGNTRGEMDRKLREYFDAGTRLVWYIDPADDTARVSTAPDREQRLGPDGVLDGRDVLPGFRLPLRELFERARRGPGA